MKKKTICLLDNKIHNRKTIHYTRRVLLWTFTHISICPSSNMWQILIFKLKNPFLCHHRHHSNTTIWLSIHLASLSYQKFQNFYFAFLKNKYCCMNANICVFWRLNKNIQQDTVLLYTTIKTSKTWLYIDLQAKKFDVLDMCRKHHYLHVVKWMPADKNKTGSFTNTDSVEEMTRFSAADSSIYMWTTTFSVYTYYKDSLVSEY